MLKAGCIDLVEVKRDSRVLFQALGIERPGQHLQCPFHDDSKGSMSVWQDETGCWRWRCHAGCGAGTIVDAVALSEGVTDREAIGRLTKVGHCNRKEVQHARRTARTIADPLPVPDRDRLMAFQEAAVLNLQQRPDLQQKWLKKRGIKLHTAKRYALGFMESCRFPEWPTWTIRNAWCIPIVAPDCTTRAVKLHLESPGERMPKCLWAPFGTAPKADPSKGIKPRHGWATLWPWPGWYLDCEMLWLVPGELKALALISGGKAAVSITAGETSPWCSRLIEPFKDREVILQYDDDKAGLKFRDATVKAIAPVARTLRTMTLGQVES